MTPGPLQVEIWSDIACPWCYVGARRFDAALAAFEHRDAVRVTWRSFQLDPAAPAERSGDRAEHLAAKYGTSVEEARRMHDHMTAVAAGDGLDLRFDSVRDGNTFDAHRLLQLAAAHGLQARLHEDLMLAHFTRGELVSDHAVLERLAVGAGLPAEEVRAVLAGDGHAEDVRDDQRTAESLGIRAVPFFVVDRALGAAGAQPPEVLRSLLEQAWEARAGLTSAGAGAGPGAGGS